MSSTQKPLTLIKGGEEGVGEIIRKTRGVQKSLYLHRLIYIVEKIKYLVLCYIMSQVNVNWPNYNSYVVNLYHIIKKIILPIYHAVKV